MTDFKPKSYRLASAWAQAAEILGVEIVAPFSVTLPSGTRVDAPVLVKSFGARNGMLIVTDYAEVRHELAALEDAGFGFSVLEEPDQDEPFVVNEFVDMLRDWGWTGRQEDEPSWLMSSS
jgi:hypothetical protein